MAVDDNNSILITADSQGMLPYVAYFRWNDTVEEWILNKFLMIVVCCGKVKGQTIDMQCASLCLIASLRAEFIVILNSFFSPTGHVAIFNIKSYCIRTKTSESPESKSKKPIRIQLQLTRQGKCLLWAVHRRTYSMMIHKFLYPISRT